MRYTGYILLSFLLLCSLTACNFLKKKVPPHELFSKAEQERKDEQLLEAAKGYDELVKQYRESELVPPALYYSGICKYSISLRSPGQKKFKERRGGLSEAKKKLYDHWIDYMNDQKDTFSYVEAIDKYLYKGNEFKTLIEEYPASDLVDDAAFQLIRLHIKAKQTTNTFTIEYALQLYTEYNTKYPQSPYRQRGLEHLIQLIEDDSDTIPNYDNITTAYQEFARTAKDLPELGRLSYVLAIKFIETADVKNAASILGVPSIIGLGTVETQRTRLNIRSGEGTGYRILAKVDKGTQLILLDKSGQWYKVHLEDGTVGYAHSDFIQLYQL